jgi:SAM-dependent methyltransferase
VLIWHVLEHLEHPRETLEEVHRILRPGGRLVVAVPNFASLQAEWSGAAWFHLDLPRHLYHFPLAALRRLLDDTGFEPISDHHFSLRQNPFGWIQSALNRVASLPRNGLYTLLQRRAPRSPAPFDTRMRVLLLGGFALLAPAALAAAVWDAFRERGATVHVVSLRRPGG